MEAKMLNRILPVDPEELQFAFQLGNAAGTQQMPIDNLENKGIDIFDKNSGEIHEIRLKDNPINRFGSAIAQEFGKDESKYYSLMNRVVALMRILSTDERAETYTKNHPDDSEFVMVNNVMIEAMADFPISDDGEIDRDAFFLKVQEILENDPNVD
jgi:hypothetical protein